MDLIKLSKKELFDICEEHGIKKYKSKNKSELIMLIKQKYIETNNYTNINHKCNIDNIHNIDIISDNIDISSDNIDISSDNIKNLTLVDLFAGTGAFSYSFHLTNKCKTIFANDMLGSSEEIFNLNNSLKLTNKNLNEINNCDIPKSYILTAGFPCQPFSIAGMQKGFEDERSNVFWKILLIIKTNSPQIVILENVKNLQSHDNGNTFKIIIDNLKKLNYYIKFSILNTCKITNVPQNRERIYIICFKDINLYNKFDFNFPEIENKPIIEYLDKDINDKYYYNNSTVIYNELKNNINKHIFTNTIYQYRRYYVRENKNNVCPTLTANMGSGGHNVPLILDDKGIRKLTPRECFNLQGFPNEYKLPKLSDSKLYSLAGNAVSVPVVSLIANKLIQLVYNI
jgi:DNA (cytosine-5)-methyltransferase 1